MSHPARTAEEQKTLDKLRITAPFIVCPDCSGRGMDEKRQFLCDTCTGVGRIYFDRERTLLDWWADLPIYQRLALVGAMVMIGTLAVVLGGFWLIDLFQ